MDQIGADGAVRTIVHFSQVAGDRERIACMPNMAELGETMYHKAYHRSNDPRAVNCPSCKKSQAFIEAQRGLDAAIRG